MKYGKYRFIVSFLAIPIALYGIFVLSPYAQAFYIALTDWQGFTATQNFVGVDNFTALARDPIMLVALKNNLILLLAIPIIIITFALFFATMLNFGGSGRGKAGIRGVGGSGLYKVVYFFPSLLSVAIIAILWDNVFEANNGLLNGFLSLIGLDSLRQVWLGDKDLALASVIAVSVWAGVGFFVIIFTAAMSSIPHELYEAALLDGASRFQTVWRLTIPLLWDAVQVAMIYLAISALDSFALVHILTVGPGGPDNATQVVSLYLYENAFTHNKFGYASAIGVTLFALTLVLTAITFRLSKRERIEY